MTFRDLVISTDFELAIPYLKSTIHDTDMVDGIIEKYRGVYNKLISLNPETPDEFIPLLIINEGFVDNKDEDWQIDDGDYYWYLREHPELVSRSYFMVSARNFDNPGDTTYWAVEFCPWAQWLLFVMRPRDINDYGAGNCLGACLYEMTFFGFDEKDISMEAEEINASSDEEATDLDLNALLEETPNPEREEIESIMIEKEIRRARNFKLRIEDDMRLE